MKSLAAKNNFNLTYLYAFGYLLFNQDTIAYLSFGDNNNQKDYLYLLKNGVPVDSIIDNFVIKKMAPVPLAWKDELIYVSEIGIPDTDYLSFLLTGIDLKNDKFKFYDRNRLHVGD